MGRNAKPIELVLLNGKSHKTKKEIEHRKQHEIKPPKNRIESPEWLCDVAKKEWDEIQGDLIELGLLSNIDVNQLAIYCDAYAKYIDATGKINKFGLVIKHTNKSGATNVVTNPHVQIAGKYADLINKFSNEFGLTPSSRAKIAIPKKEEREKSEFEQKFGDL